MNDLKENQSKFEKKIELKIEEQTKTINRIYEILCIKFNIPKDELISKDK